MVYKRNYKRKFNKKRRGWYAEAKIGKGVPFLGGTGIRFGKRALGKYVKRAVQNSEETKVKATPLLGSSAFVHNQIYTISPVQEISQGVGDDQRIGQSIFIRHVKLRGSISNNGNNAEVYFRVMVLWNDLALEAQWVDFAGPSLGSTDLFYSTAGGTGSVNTELHKAFVNNKRGSTIICDRLYHLPISVLAAGQVREIKYSIDCPIFKKLTYDYAENPPYYFNKKQLYVAIIPWIRGGVQGISNVGDFNCQALVTYKDA